ncbi:SGNH/GDSL hydrolase family protein [Burkholderia sp. JSH-S8]|nr:SGNH/GDSL hydrolase family protein [Burkholderia sp. JSH-S8]
MKNRITALAAGTALVFSLCACGGGGDNAPSSPTTSGSVPAPASAAKPKTHIVIYAGGDSTNSGENPDSSTRQTAPSTGHPVIGRAIRSPAQLLQADFDKTLGAGVVTVIDGSIPGSTLAADLQGTAPVPTPLATRLAQLPTPADIVITNSQINDQYLLRETPDQYRSWLQQWAQTVKAAGAVPVLEEPNPICRPEFDIPITDEFVATMRAFAATQGLTVLPTYDAFKLYPAWNLKLISSDCVHPDDAGYAFKESNYFPSLLPVAKEILGWREV